MTPTSHALTEVGLDLVGARYDGWWAAAGAYQFTDIDPSSPAYMATFYVHPGEDVQERLEAKRREFSGEAGQGSNRPPSGR